MSTVSMAKMFPGDLSGLVVTDFDDTMLESRSVTAMKAYAETGIWQDMNDSEPRKILGAAEAVVDKADGKQLELVILSSASKENIQKEWMMATGKKLPKTIQVVGEVKEKGQALVKLLRKRSGKKGEVLFIDDSDLHIRQVEGVKKDLLTQGWIVKTLLINKETLL